MAVKLPIVNDSQGCFVCMRYAVRECPTSNNSSRRVIRRSPTKHWERHCFPWHIGHQGQMCKSTGSRAHVPAACAIDRRAAMAMWRPETPDNGIEAST